jgi:hypothetical protein
MKSIETRYLQPTNTRGARIRVSDCGDHVLIVKVDPTLTDDRDAHDEAVRLLAFTLGWFGTMIRGATKGGFVYVFADDHAIDLEKMPVTDRKAR